jgi:hypothetical protein
MTMLRRSPLNDDIPLPTDAGLYLPQLGVVNAYVLADGSLSPQFNQAVGIFLIAWMIVTLLFVLGMFLPLPHFPVCINSPDRFHRRTTIFRSGAIHSGVHCVVSLVPCYLAIHRSAQGSLANQVPDAHNRFHSFQAPMPCASRVVPSGCAHLGQLGGAPWQGESKVLPPGYMRRLLMGHCRAIVAFGRQTPLSR